MTERKKERGVCKVWFEDRGFGFIKPAWGDSDIFVHLSGLVDGLERLHKQDAVEYAVSASRDGRWMAVDVKLV